MIALKGKGGLLLALGVSVFCLDTFASGWKYETGKDQVIKVLRIEQEPPKREKLERQLPPDTFAGDCKYKTKDQAIKVLRIEREKLERQLPPEEWSLASPDASPKARWLRIENFKPEVAERHISPEKRKRIMEAYERIMRTSSPEELELVKDYNPETVKGVRAISQIDDETEEVLSSSEFVSN
ncbi:MAG: hypothetical protein LBG09_00115 [Puniceicoccales bacterium]|nr:hypothetical protein [Puniceicoccales bacterium]